jgi:hypothetical protein
LDEIQTFFEQNPLADLIIPPALRLPPLRFGEQNRKIFCFDILLTQNCGNTYHPQSRFAVQQAALRLPFLFARLFFGFAKNFSEGDGLQNSKVGGWSTYTLLLSLPKYKLPKFCLSLPE